MSLIRNLVTCAIGLLASLPACAHDHAETMPAGARLGSVSFETSCKPAVNADFNRAVALLHSFWHSEAQHVFEKVTAADPDCAIGYWGIAMSHFHLGLGGWPTPADLKAGGEALSMADAALKRARAR